MRIGDYIGTYTGKQFWPLDPHPEDICIEDIAHALSNICRFNGHTKRFYSVAEHSLNVANYLSKVKDSSIPLILHGLLHDAAEAYACDIPRPLKRYIQGYKNMEHAIMDAICKAFELNSVNSHQAALIAVADNYILALEAKELMNNTAGWGLVDVPVGAKLGHWQNTEIEFIGVFRELKKFAK